MSLTFLLLPYLLDNYMAVLVFHCCVTNHHKTWCIKTTIIFLSSVSSVGQALGKDLAGQSVSLHAASAMGTWLAWMTCFQDDSLTWLARWCCEGQELSQAMGWWLPLHTGLCGLPGLPHRMVVRFQE